MSDFIKIHTEGSVGVITLNRPEALNALNHEMTNTIQAQLCLWREDDRIHCVFVHGKGRAFCAGGDVRAIHANRRNSIDKLIAFFRDEYKLNQLIYHYPKPYIAYLDGITMGGGVGISWHGSHRIVTNNFSFAMPEVNIGFFPDAGVRYHLARLPNHIGLYLALSGRCIHADDALAMGIATHFAKPNEAAVLIQQLAAGEPLQTKKGILTLDANLLACYEHDSLQGIHAALATSYPKLATELADRSLFSLQETLRAYHDARALPFDAVIHDDLEIARRCLQQGDFYEGIRAALVDKDKKPAWQRAKIIF